MRVHRQARFTIGQLFFLFGLPVVGGQYRPALVWSPALAGLPPQAQDPKHTGGAGGFQTPRAPAPLWVAGLQGSSCLIIGAPQWHLRRGRLRAAHGARCAEVGRPIPCGAVLRPCA